MPLKNKLTWLDLGVFSGYVVAVSVAVAHHEPWADEAQAWLVARDVPFWKMIFRQMRYEDSPGLWHALLWVAQHGFHAPYSAMNWIGAALAAAGAGVLIFCAPFPRPVRYLMSFSYYVSYHYAVIARPYVMLLLFGGLAAIFYRRRSPISFAIAIALLCGTSVHGAILAAAISLGAGWHVVVKRDWEVGPLRTHYLTAVAIVIMAGIMVVVIVFPPADAGAEVARLFESAHLDRFLQLLGDTITEPWPIGGCLLLALAVFAVRSGESIVFLAGVGGLYAFEWLIFSLFQHWGAIVIALIVCLWIAWPRERKGSFEPTMAALLLSGLFAIQTVWAVSAWRHDFTTPYSGSKDAAIYLKQVGADHARIFGFCYPVVAVQAYFDRSIFADWPTAYSRGTKNEDSVICSMDCKTHYDYVVMPLLHGDDDPNAEAVEACGYVPVHISPGRAFFKQGVQITETFVIYRHIF
ncbi:MAG TPA: hypothetical protein VMI10_26355 [Terriglobales bacterium]|nr:hypothetical protein [Terriglobales bacterium]